MVNTFAIGSIILVAGIFGGLVNYFTVYSKKGSGSNRKCLGIVLAGVAASCLVPLFLSTISSDLIVNTRNDHKYYFVFGGLCLVAAIFSGEFINSISIRVLEQVEKATEKANKTDRKTDQQQFQLQDIIKQFEDFLTSDLMKLNNENDDNGKLQ